MAEPESKSWTHRLMARFRLSIAAKASWAMCAALVGLSLLTWLIYRQDPRRLAWGDYMDWGQFGWLCGLIAVTCTVTYWSVRVWFRDLPSIDDSFERAWRCGLGTLAERGISLQDSPLFLLLGCDETELQSRFVEAAGCRLISEPLPATAAPVRWFIAEDRIILCCNNLGSFAVAQQRLPLYRRAASHAASSHSAEELASRFEIPTEALQTTTAFTYSPQAQRSVQLGASSTSQPSIALLEPSKLPSPSSVSLATAQKFASELEQRIDSTEQWLRDLQNDAPANHPQSTQTVYTDDWQPDMLTSNEQVETFQRLATLARKLKAARGSIAPLNGIVVRIATDDLVNADKLARQVGRSLRQDLNVVQDELGVQAPVTIVCDQLHRNIGFRELVRRLGPQPSHAAVIGRHLSVRVIPNPAVVDRLADEAGRSLSDIEASLLRSRDVLRQPGNAKLFRLRMLTRSRLAPVLKEFLVESLCKAPTQDDDQSIMSAGVYFAGTGEQPTERGFLRGIWDRVMAQQAYLRWTNGEQRTQKRLMLTVRILQAVCVAMATLLIVQLANR